MAVIVVDAAATTCQVVDRGVSWCLSASEANRRRAAVAGMVALLVAHAVPEFARYRSRRPVSTRLDHVVVDVARPGG